MRGVARARTKGSSSILKKRTKKLLSVSGSTLDPRQFAMDSSFLLLFFKKEQSSLIRARRNTP
jgi:hypothetical protein